MSASNYRPPVTEDVGEAIAKEIKGPPSSSYAPEVPMAFLSHPTMGAQIDPVVLSTTRRRMIWAGGIVVALLVLLLAGKFF